MINVNRKPVKLELVGMDSNAFALLGAFGRAARKEGWSKEEIDAVRSEATSGDYSHLLAVLMRWTDPRDLDERSEEDWAEWDEELRNE